LNLERVAEIAAREFFFNFALYVRDVCPGIYNWARKNLPRLVWSFREQSSSLGSEEDPSFESGSETSAGGDAA
jgi:hypothetical protein